MRIKKLMPALFLSIQSLAPITNAQAQQPIDRPPQYVLLGFDGSSSIDVWRSTQKFSLEAEEALNANVKFTYFISGVYFVSRQNKREYITPTKTPGSSAIGFSNTTEEIVTRLDEVNQAIEDGHEMASHANGHYNGAELKWGLNDWRQEFAEFNKLIFDVFRINNLKPAQLKKGKLLFDQEDVVGFRAPQLGNNPEMFAALRDYGFKYDTSKVSKSNYWPEKNNGIWNFPLASLVIAGTAKRTLSMDYNFYVAQSKGVSQPENKEQFKKEMYDTYMNYFKSNYYGNRAPLHIGHHFSMWNGGAYWEAMKDFAKSVCGAPEVLCVTYKEYMNWLDILKPEQLQAYRAGKFDRMKSETYSSMAQSNTYDLDVRFQLNESQLELTSKGQSQSQLNQLRTLIKVDGNQLKSKNLTLNEVLGSKTSATVEVQIKNKKGREILSSTQILSRDQNGTVQLTEPLELRALEGDLPEAHSHHE